MAETRQTYITNLTEKLRQILTFCFNLKADLVVFPEYSVPVTALEALRQFSTHMAIVAGIGYLQRSDIDTLQAFGFDTEGVVRTSNAVALLTRDGNYIVTKKNPAAGETITAGTGARTFQLSLANGTFTVGVAICLDYVRERSFLNQEDPDIVVVPALSANTSEFVQGTPRDFVRVFANHAAYGGTYIGVPALKGMNFSDANGTVPLSSGIEGIVIVDWDSRNPYPVRPSATLGPDHRLVARSALLYAGRDQESAQAVHRAITALAEPIMRIDDFLQLSDAARSALDQSGLGYELLRESFDTLRTRVELLSEEEVRVLGRHCLLSTGILTMPEWKYSRCVAVAEGFKRLVDLVPDVVGTPFIEYEKVARSLAKNVRSNLVEIRHRGTTSRSGSETEGEQLVFFARLGRYDVEEAVKSLPRQLTLLRAIADLQDPHLVVRYRIQTIRGSATAVQAMYDIICTTHGRSQEQLEALRESIGQLIGVTFASAYSMSWTASPAMLEEALTDVRISSAWWAEIREIDDPDSQTLHPHGIPDWGLVIDLLRRLTPLTTLELHCSALPTAEAVTASFEGHRTELTSADTQGTVPSIEDYATAARVYWQALLSESADPRRLSIRVFLGCQEPLPRSIMDTVGIEVAGAGSYTVVDRTGTRVAGANPNGHEERSGLNPIDALKVFHPPYGDLYRSSGVGRHDLDLPTDETAFPPTGISLGTARIRHVRADEQVDVRLTEVDRLRHMYVVGKTGSGKTNLMKVMAAQDVQVAGRGVTIIDPHGDLVDHVLRVIPEDRVSEVTLIDLARADALPVLNPLDLDRKDVTVRDRTIQELISLLRTRTFHEYTGPRFEELVRLAFQTILDEGYPEPASFVEVSRLLMDDDAQKKIATILKDEELRKRWSFQSNIAQDREYGSLIHYVTSKFDELARDTSLRCVVGGAKSTLNIDDIVKRGGILLVRIPEAVIGRQAADFIGSLILLQLRLAIIRRRESGEVKTFHFVYVDEFQNFANTDFHTLVAEARKFNIGFTLANQNLEQLREFRTYTGVHEQRLLSAILGNVANLVIFGVGAFDAHILGEQISVREAEILRIGRYEALAKVLVDGVESTPFTLRTSEAPKLQNPRVVEAIENRMREHFWVDRNSVLGEIAGRFTRVLDFIDHKREEEAEAQRKKREEEAEAQRKKREEEAEAQRKKQGDGSDPVSALNNDSDSGQAVELHRHVDGALDRDDEDDDVKEMKMLAEIFAKTLAEEFTAGGLAIVNESNGRSPASQKARRRPRGNPKPTDTNQETN